MLDVSVHQWDNTSKSAYNLQASEDTRVVAADFSSSTLEMSQKKHLFKYQPLLF